MLRITGGTDPLIGRPLALYDTTWNDNGEPWAIDVVYLIAGNLTRRLAQIQPSQQVDVWGPLGNGFPVSSAQHLVMVAGGIGYTPFLAVAREALGDRSYGGRAGGSATRVSLCFGARSREYLCDLDDFRRCGVNVRVATEDGSMGVTGRATDLLEAALVDRDPATHIVTCGPDAMMAAVSEIAAREGVSCEVSLETPMACGIGICFSCVARIRQPDGGWDYRRTCLEGPVFDAHSVVW